MSYFPPVDTPHLTLQQTQRLAAWADMVLAREAERVAHLPPAEREKIMADKETAVSQIFLLCNEMMQHLTLPAAGVVDERRLRLFKNLAWLTGHPAPRAHRRYVLGYKEACAANDQAAAFHNLFQAILVSSLPD